MKNLKKKWFLVGTILLVTVTLFIACDLLEGLDTPITSVGITVIAPVTGNTPNTTATGSRPSQSSNLCRCSHYTRRPQAAFSLLIT